MKAETDLYQPVRDYLVANGYTVRGEVKDCDITALKGEDLIIVELKRTFNASLIIQATQRQKITDSVYVALPRPASGMGTPQWRGIRHLLRRLELGLILVSLRPKKSKVEVVFHPVPFDRKKTKAVKRAVIREIEGRVGDFNVGGSTRTKLATAYRENAIRIACCLEKHGQLSPKQLRNMGTGDKTQSILASNFYGWFERVDRGIYALKPGALSDMAQHPDLLEHCRAEVDRRLRFRL